MRILITMLTTSPIPQRISATQVNVDLDSENATDSGIIDLLQSVDGVFSTPDGVSTYTREANEANKSAGIKAALQEAHDFVAEQVALDSVIDNTQDDDDIILVTFGVHC